MTFPDIRSVFDRDVLLPMLWVAWFFLFYVVIRTVALAQTGALDRGEFGKHRNGKRPFWHLDLFLAFLRFDGFAFFLCPLIMQRSSLAGKLIALVLLGVYFLIAIVSGARGLVFFPIFFVGIGLFFFRSLKNLKLDILGLLLGVVLLPLVVFVDAYRNTDAYRATKPWTLWAVSKQLMMDLRK